MIIAQLVNSSAQLTQLQVRHLLELMQEAMADQKSGEYISKDPKFSGLLKAIVIRYGSEVSCIFGIPYLRENNQLAKRTTIARYREKNTRNHEKTHLKFN